jgi:hypothetical protein
LQVAQIETVDLRSPALQTALEASEYRITFLEPFLELADRAQALLSTLSLPRQRRERAYDLRPLILDLQTLPQDGSGHPQLSLRLAAREGATGRPEEVIAVLGCDPQLARVHRTRLLFRVK